MTMIFPNSVDARDVLRDLAGFRGLGGGGGTCVER